MNRATRAANGLVRAWVHGYTLGLPDPARAERRAEIESDLWEHCSALGWSARAAVELVLRCLLGMPADLVWRTEQARPGQRLVQLAGNVLVWMERAAGWVVRRGVPGLTPASAWGLIALGVLLLVVAPFQPSEPGIAVGGGWFVLSGLAIRWGSRQVALHPVRGLAALLAGAAPIGLLLLNTVLAPVVMAGVVALEVRRAWLSRRAGVAS
ncbi:MAG TPA: hypothetical protein PKI89_11905 [Tepidiformaceae bacterium]|nr:hypothetical protein [Tepidiformaceae bacterium]